MNPLLAGRRFSVADEGPDISASHCIKPRRGKKKKALLAVSVSHILGRPPSKPSLSSSCSTLWECLLSSTQRWMTLQHSESLWELSFLQTDTNGMIWTQHCFFLWIFCKTIVRGTSGPRKLNLLTFFLQPHSPKQLQGDECWVNAMEVSLPPLFVSALKAVTSPH